MNYDKGNNFDDHDDDKEEVMRRNYSVTWLISCSLPLPPSCSVANAIKETVSYLTANYKNKVNRKKRVCRKM